MIKGVINEKLRIQAIGILSYSILFFSWFSSVITKYLCSGYLRNETAVVSIVLPFVYSGLAHFAVHLKISHRKKGRNSQMDCEKKEEILRWTVHTGLD